MSSQNIHYLKRVASTNDYLNELLNHYRPTEMSLYVAHEQTKGKGQRGTNWFSEPGKNHTGTTVFYPDFLPPDKQFKISQAVALAIIKTLSSYLTPAKLFIKWPNDILYADRKLAGILIETSLLGNTLDYVLAGTGINLNQEVFPDDLINAISIRNIIQMDIDVQKFNEHLYAEIQRHYDPAYILSESLNHEYQNHLFRFGVWAPYLDNSGKFRARITGVNNYGHLLLETPEGKIHNYAFKEVSYL